MQECNIWVICQYFSEERYNEICPDDLEKFLQLFPHQKLFQCIGRDNDFMYLKKDKDIYRVKESLLKTTEEPKFKIGETVILINKNEKAVVVSIGWHYKLAEAIYTVSINGKVKRTRYFAKDLKGINDIL
ncbi:hypothetical protein D7X87_26760 [bacterium D16-54]|nr:hypothetical protein D7X87_26760 [bacterium D16-54]RKJ08306.1 hypothetical protein D7X65_26755 [bacterium D16-56]